MFTGLCNCGSDQLWYLGIVEVEGNTIVEEFRCEECMTISERRTAVDLNDADDVDRANYLLREEEFPRQFPLT